MKILFNSNIAEVRVFNKARYSNSLWYGTGKRKIGRRLGIFPVYEKADAIFYKWDNGYWGEVADYNTEERSTFLDTTDGTFYYKPHCEIHLNSGTNHEVFFETVEELTAYVAELKALAPHITLK